MTEQKAIKQQGLISILKANCLFAQFKGRSLIHIIILFSVLLIRSVEVGKKVLTICFFDFKPTIGVLAVFNLHTRELSTR